ncbi:uncharacterized protein TNCV_3326341 [Trichonephila clavipes]|nr:uncharacterized protein TNCV_3326341 [Trichonephila clavipes]
MWLQDVMDIPLGCHGATHQYYGYCSQWHSIPSHQLWERYFAVKQMQDLRRSPRCLHTRTRLSLLLRLNQDLSLKTTWFHSAAVQLHRAWHHSKRRRRSVGVKGSTRNGRSYPKCPRTRILRMVRVDTGAPTEGATTCAWMTADEAVGCTCAFLMM